MGTFVIAPDADDDNLLTYRIDAGLTVPMDRQRSANDKQAAADAEHLRELVAAGDYEPSVRSVRSVLKCGQARAQRAIDAYKRLFGVPRQQGAA